MPKLNKAVLMMRAQALPEEKAKILLTFLLSFCLADETFYKAVNAGLRNLEKSGEISEEKNEPAK